MKKYVILYILLISIMVIVSCKKSFLETKPDMALLVPTTLSDFQYLLDNISIMNNTPSLPIIAADEYVLQDKGLTPVKTAPERGMYLWSYDPYQGESVGDWNTPYQQIFYANVVLDGLAKVKPEANEIVDFNRVKGSALFFRSYALFNLLQEFCKPYDSQTAATDWGIPVPLSSDVNIRPGRGKLQDAYNRVIADLNEANSLLPQKGLTKNRPGQRATMALLARIYLVMSNYNNALQAANAALSIDNKLIDYNTITIGKSSPFPEVLPNGNDEVIYYSPRIATSFFGFSVGLKIEPSLLITYDSNDLRNKIYFFNKGNGIISNKNYDGLTNDELYLIRAECYIRNQQIQVGMNELNTLLIKRWKTNTYNQYGANNEEEALRILIAERRKELVGRGLRWQDLRRFNKDSRFALQLTRTYNGATYILPPNDRRYVFPIPDDEIRTSGLPQN